MSKSKHKCMYKRPVICIFLNTNPFHFSFTSSSTLLPFYFPTIHTLHSSPIWILPYHPSIVDPFPPFFSFHRNCHHDASTRTRFPPLTFFLATNNPNPHFSPRILMPIHQQHNLPKHTSAMQSLLIPTRMSHPMAILPSLPELHNTAWTHSPQHSLITEDERERESNAHHMAMLADARRCTPMSQDRSFSNPIPLVAFLSRCPPCCIHSFPPTGSPWWENGLIAYPAPRVTRELGHSMFIRIQSLYNSNYTLSTTRSLQPLHFPFLPSSMSYTPPPNPLFPFILLSPISSHALTLFRRYPSRFDPQPLISISTRQSSRSTTTTAQSWSSYASRSTHAYPTPLLSPFMIWYSFQQQSLYLTRETRELLNVHSLIFVDLITSSPFSLFNKQSHYCF